jgi:hypothetical protein
MWTSLLMDQNNKLNSGFAIGPRKIKYPPDLYVIETRHHFLANPLSVNTFSLSKMSNMS